TSLATRVLQAWHSPAALAPYSPPSSARKFFLPSVSTATPEFRPPTRPLVPYSRTPALWTCRRLPDAMPSASAGLLCIRMRCKAASRVHLSASSEVRPVTLLHRLPLSRGLPAMLSPASFWAFRIRQPGSWVVPSLINRLMVMGFMYRTHGATAG